MQARSVCGVQLTVCVAFSHFCRLLVLQRQRNGWLGPLPHGMLALHCMCAHLDHLEYQWPARAAADIFLIPLPEQAKHQQIAMLPPADSICRTQLVEDAE
jgi:hypothetical protein